MLSASQWRLLQASMHRCADDSVSAGIRDQIVQAVELKFNCFFLMPVIDAFPTALREVLTPHREGTS